MTRSALTVISASLLLLAPSAASAQVFAGGSIGAGSASNPVGTSELGFRVAGSRITARGVALLQCRRNRTTEVEGTGSAPLNPDGSFSLTFNRKRLQPTTIRGRYTRRVVITGQVGGAEIRGRLEASASGRGLRGCSGAFDIVARQPPSVLPPEGAPAPASATLIGMTSGTKGGPFALNLRVSADGRRVSQLVAGARYTCRRLKPYQETNYSPAIRVNPDGTFRYVERFKVRFADVTDSVTVTTEGRFVNGGATGTWEARATSRSRETGRVVDRCGTGALTWAAALV